MGRRRRQRLVILPVLVVGLSVAAAASFIHQSPAAGYTRLPPLQRSWRRPTTTSTSTSTSSSNSTTTTQAAADPSSAEPPRAYFDAAAAVSSSSKGVRATLEAAGVPSEGIDRALRAFPGLAACDARAEVVRRLEHLNFLIEQGVYTFAQAAELVATQPRFLELKFGVVHEDASLFVMEKPPDVRMDVPAREDGRRKWANEFTCADWLDEAALGLDKKRFAHNLDSGTSGILVVSKDRETAARCNELFSQRLVEKEYLALVFGHVQEDALFIDRPIEKDPTSDFRMRVVEQGGKKAQTRVEVLARGYLTLQGPHLNAPVTKLRLRPITGRRHQLRVHAAHMGHPMVGDAAYADDWSTYRLFLHAHRLRLPLAPPERDLWLSTADPFVDALCPAPIT